MKDAASWRPPGREGIGEGEGGSGQQNRHQKQKNGNRKKETGRSECLVGGHVGDGFVCDFRADEDDPLLALQLGVELHRHVGGAV